MFQRLAHNPCSQPPHVPQYPLGYGTLLVWTYTWVDATEEKIVASAIWLLVLQPIRLRWSLFLGFLFEVRSASYGRIVTFKDSTWLSISQWVTQDPPQFVTIYGYSFYSHCYHSSHAVWGTLSYCEMNIKCIVNTATLLFWDDSKAGIKYRKTRITCVIYHSIYSIQLLQ
jgi:hypothetical protein